MRDAQHAAGSSSTCTSERGRSWTELTLDRRFEGWDGIAHGGIICTILDEVMAWALVAEDNWGVTARMNVEFKRPVQIGRPIRADGWVTRSRRRVVDTAGRIIDAETGETLATAEGTFVAADGRPQARAPGTLRLPARRRLRPTAWTAREPRHDRRPASDRLDEPRPRARTRSTSPVTARAVAFVAEHKPAAEALGDRLADDVNDPDAFAATLGRRPRTPSPTRSTSRASSGSPRGSAPSTASAGR